MTINRERKRIFYVDFDYIENGTRLTKLEAQTREKLQTTRQMDAHIFWLDVEAGLQGLSKMERVCFSAVLIKGYSEREVAKMLCISQPAVHQYLRAAKEKMKYFLKRGYQNPRK